jgi:Leucine-rich repeat (LRR) protein
MAPPRISARAVQEDGFADLALEQNGHDHDQLPNVEELKSIPNRKRRSCSTLLIIGIAGLVVLLIVLIPLSVKYSQNKNNAASPEASARMRQTTAFLLDYMDHASLSTAGSPQHRAAQWMADTDELQLPLERESSPAFLQRFALATLFFATQGDTTWTHKINFLSNQHECDWNANFVRDDNITVLMGVMCNEKNGTVNQLFIRKLILNGGYRCIRVVAIHYAPCGMYSNGHALYRYSLLTHSVIIHSQLLLRHNTENTGMTGTIPPEIAFLENLDRLVLPQNNLYGSLPDSMETMTKLTSLLLLKNEFAETIPTWIGSLTNLVKLGLSQNNFYGSIPDSFELLEELQVLALDDNDLSGNVKILDVLQELQEVYLEKNQFTGTIDYHWLSTLFNCKILDASNNLFKGDIPSELLSLSELNILDLSGNALDGTIAGDLQLSSNLRFLSLHNNSLANSIPDSFKNLKGLEHLDLSHNQLEGSIPDALGFLSQLTYLFLSDNLFFEKGPIPEWILGLTNLAEISLRNTQRHDGIPEWMDEMKNLLLLDVSQNKLNGTIPTELGALTNLRYLLLSSNELTGGIPTTLNQLDKLCMCLLLIRFRMLSIPTHSRVICFSFGV